jgi:tetratricopeptide (TPR) repeat protein
MSKHAAVALAIVAVALIALVAGWRAVAALWFDDLGNLRLAKGDAEGAVVLFERGLAFAPRSALLLEDRGRALLDRDPAAALADFKAAACGSACVAEMGDAEARMGDAGAAVAEYLQANAAVRLAAMEDRIAATGKYDDAIALETALAQRLTGDALLRADLAAAYAKIGRLSAEAAVAQPQRADEYHRRAIASFKRATDIAPFNEGYLLSYASAQKNWGDKDAARSAFEHVLVLHPHQADAEAALAQLDAGAAASPQPVPRAPQVPTPARS